MLPQKIRERIHTAKYDDLAPIISRDALPTDAGGQYQFDADRFVGAVSEAGMSYPHSYFGSVARSSDSVSVGSGGRLSTEWKHAGLGAALELADVVHG